MSAPTASDAAATAPRRQRRTDVGDAATQGHPVRRDGEGWTGMTALQEAHPRMSPRSILIWTGVAILGAIAWGVLALSRGEQISAVWLDIAALGSYDIAYRVYERFIVKKVLRADDPRATPGGAARHGHRLPADGPSRAVRPPLRGDRRRRPAGGPRTRRADGLPAWHDLDHRRCHLRRRRAGHGHALLLHAARRQEPRPDGT